MKRKQGKMTMKGKAKKTSSKVKVRKIQNLLGSAKKKMNSMRKKSTKTLRNTKDKVYATEKEIVKYVKDNPVKSISTVALVGLIAGFVSRLKK